jgi:hypothetical protein
MKWGRTTETTGSLTLPEVQAHKTALDAEMAAWTTRRDDVAARLTALRERAEGLKVQAAAAALEGTDPKAVRKERAAVLAELEELEAAVAMADEKRTALTQAQAQAARAVALAVALDRLGAVERLATGLDQTWAPMLRDLEILVLADQEAAAALHQVVPHSNFQTRGPQLLRVLTWRAADLLDLSPRPDVQERVSVAEFLGRSQIRQRLEAELATAMEATR